MSPADDLSDLTPTQLRERVRATGATLDAVKTDLAATPSYALALEGQRVARRRGEALAALRATIKLVTPDDAAPGQLLDIAA